MTLVSAVRWRNPLAACMALMLLAVGGSCLGADEAKPSAIPLKRVVLFTSGVGFFEHAGQVENNAQVEMNFNIEDVNDLLKSMVVEDLDGGRVSTVSYGSKDPITKTLKTFAVDLTTKPTVAQPLEQIRGERVEIEAAQKITGVIVGVERHKRTLGEKEIITVEVLNLLTDEGLRSVPLDAVGRIRLVNEKLDAEFRKALSLLATAHATDKKTVSLSFLGEGSRRVRVGYIQETPIWKTTYRLVLGEKDATLLQGWAIIENTTEDDWSDVQLTLVSGRPISFVMDLYEPLYVPRPEEQLQLYASLRPQTYGQDLAAREERFRGMAGGMGMGGMGGMGGMAVAGRPMAPAASAPAEAEKALAEGADRTEKLGLLARRRLAEPALGDAIRQSVAAAAEGGEVGELFQYAVATPVTLSRQKSAMLPIVNAEVKGQKVSIYNAAVHVKHPLAGLKLVNSTDLHLMQGPITVFDGGAYAGDAKIEDLPPGGERLISYAIDLDTEVAPKPIGKPEELLTVRLTKGTMIATRKYAKSLEYTIKNSGSKEETVLVEHPIADDWKLVAPKEPTEKTRDRYRFAVAAAPGKPAVLVVEEDRTAAEHIALSNLNDDAIRIYLSAQVVDQKVKDALADIVERKHAIEQLATQRQQLEAQIETINQEQTRIRSNMQQLDRTGDLYKRYVTKFTEQEDTIEKLREEIKKLQDQATEAQRSLDEYMMGLEL